MTSPDLAHTAVPLPGSTNRKPRPLSPHLQVYKPQISSVLSIFHRMTGIALCFGLLIVGWWVIAAASGPDRYLQFRGYAGSVVGQILLLGWAWALMYHTLAGIRHLFWDAGYGFSIPAFTRSGWAVVIGSLVLTAVIALSAYNVLGGVI